MDKGRKVKGLLSTFAWSVEHLANGNRFLDEFGNLLYKLCCRLPEGALDLRPERYCVFCRLARKKSGGEAI